MLKRAAEEQGYRVREGVAEDVPALRHIERRAAQLFRTIGFDFCADGPTRSHDEHRRVLHEGVCLVATTAEDHVVAFAMVLPVDGEAHLMEIDTDPDHQRRGLSEILIEHAGQWALRCGFRALTLTTFRDVPWNAPYYARLGFSVLEPTPDRRELLHIIADERNGGFHAQPRVVMRKVLR